MSSRILVVTAQGEVRYLGSESEAVRVLTIQPTGARGEAGAAGVGVPTGGATNDILKKTSATNYATAWETPTSAATANTVVRRDASGDAAFNSLTSDQIKSTITGQSIDFSAGAFSINLGGEISFANSTALSTYLQFSPTVARYITFPNASGNIALCASTTGAIASADITDATSAATANTIVKRDASGGAAFVALTGTGNWSTTGHFFSNPGTSEAGHFLTKNGTTPTIVAGRSAWFSDSSGSPQFKNGTSSAITLIYSGGALGTPSSGTLTSCTGLPISTGVSGLGTNVAAFLTTPTSANLAAAVTDDTGTGSLVFATSPTIVTPTISRGSVGQVFTAQDNNSVVTTMTTDSFGRNFLQINGKSGATSQAGAYVTASGYEEAWAYVNCLSNTSGQRVMRFGNKSNFFSIQRLNDAITLITATPFSIANDAPTNAFYMLTSGTIGCGTSTPSEKSLLDLSSTTKGFLPPRMTTVQRDAITSVPAGLMIYNTTTNKLNVYTTAWEAVTSA